MIPPIPNHFRERFVQFYLNEAQQSKSVAVKAFESPIFNRRTLYRILAEYEKTGSFQLKPRTGRKSNRGPQKFPANSCEVRNEPRHYHQKSGGRTGPEPINGRVCEAQSLWSKSENKKTGAEVYGRASGTRKDELSENVPQPDSVRCTEGGDSRRRELFPSGSR